MTIRGRVLRFDPVKGYGFIAPDGGGEDVFLHVNDLVSGDKHQLNPNTLVEYVVEHGDRGAKASEVSIVGVAPSNNSSAAGGDVAARARAEGDEEFVDVVPVSDFQRELTEGLLALEPQLTGRQILNIRELFVAQAKRYGWVTG